MLRSRTIKEGSVGLLILTGIAVFGGIALWLKGVKFGEKNYQIVAEFSDVNGIQVGDSVRYRGLKVGKISQIKPATNGVDVVMAIDSSQLLIPKGSTIQASSSGLIGETFIEIEPPVTQILNNVNNVSPLGQKCNNLDLILCDGDRLQGEAGVTIDDLFPLMYELSLRLSEDPELFKNVGLAAKNASNTAAEISKLTQEVSVLIANAQKELGNFSDAAKAVTNVAENASGQINTTAEKYQQTAEELSLLVKNANELLIANRSQLVNTLNTISDTSESLQNLVIKLDRTVATTDTQKLVENLETLTANAADASANLKQVSETFGDSNNLVTLQQTLDSARVTFANAQKITADLEEITGDADFRNNIRNLVNGLSNLVSSTEELEQQIQTNITAQELEKTLSTVIK